MRISAKADYAVRAALELAAAPDTEPVKGERLSEAQEIPLQFLEHILLELKHARLVRARRGARGGYWLAKPAHEDTPASGVPGRRGAPGQHPGPGARADQIPGKRGAPLGCLDRRPRLAPPGARARDGRRPARREDPGRGPRADRGRRRVGDALVLAPGAASSIRH